MFIIIFAVNIFSHPNSDPLVPDPIVPDHPLAPDPLVGPVYYSYLEIRDGMHANSTIIGTRLCGSALPTLITTSGSELHLKFFSSPLYETYTSSVRTLDKVMKKVEGFKGFRIKVEAEKSKFYQFIFVYSILIEKMSLLKFSNILLLQL